MTNVLRAATIVIDVAQLQEWSRALTDPASCNDIDDATRIDLIRAFEQVKCQIEAAQLDVTADFDLSQRALAAARGVPAARRGRGVAAQVALARRESHHRGQQHVGLAQVLRDELPCMRSALRAGRITEWRATLVARETACLTLADRLLVDQDVAGNHDRLERLGERELVGRCRQLAYELDPASVVAARRKAEKDRHVSLRAAPDVMSKLSALLPVKDGVAVFACLDKTAKR